MCYECYMGYGMPKIVNEKTKKAAELIEKVYDFSEVGGNSHIVLDDWNLEDVFILDCLDNMQNWTLEDVYVSEAQFDDEYDCLQFLLGLSIEERASAMALNSELFKIDSSGAAEKGV